MNYSVIMKRVPQLTKLRSASLHTKDTFKCLGQSRILCGLHFPTQKLRPAAGCTCVVFMEVV